MAEQLKRDLRLSAERLSKARFETMVAEKALELQAYARHTHGIHMAHTLLTVYTRHMHSIHTAHTRHAHGVRKAHTYTRYTHGTHTAYSRHAYGIHMDMDMDMVYARPTRHSHGHGVCTAYTYGMHVAYAWHTHGTHTHGIRTAHTWHTHGIWHMTTPCRTWPHLASHGTCMGMAWPRTLCLCQR